MKQLPDEGRGDRRAVKPRTIVDARSWTAARTEAEVKTRASIRLEDALERTNLQRALRHVEQNAGAPGIDGMTVDVLRPYLRENWPRIARALLDGTYRPAPVRRVFIPKASGGERPLGIPTALDRFLQQALLQALQPHLDRGFSPHSYGFRPGRSAHQAVRAAKEHMLAGYIVVVDVDIASFFDRVNHDVLMGRLAKRIRDERILVLIRRYLGAGLMIEGVNVRTTEGTPQGGPLSPLLANVLLDDLDRELARRGHRFVRYADDCNVYVRSRRAGERVMAGLRQFLSKRLRLQVNEAKSAVDLISRRGFLGFSFGLSKGRVKVRFDPESLRRVKAVIRRITRRKWRITMTERIQRLNEYLIGWLGYFRLVETPTPLDDLDEWLGRRLRAVRWKEWKRGRTRYRMLRRLGVPHFAAKQGHSKKGPWPPPLVVDARMVNNVGTTDFGEPTDAFSLTFSESMNTAVQGGQLFIADQDGTLVRLNCGVPPNNMNCTWDAPGVKVTLTVVDQLEVPALGTVGGGTTPGLQIPFNLIGVSAEFSDLSANLPDWTNSPDLLVDFE